MAGCSCSATKTAAPPASAVTPPLTAEMIAENNRGVALMGRFDYAAAHDVFAQLVDRWPNWSDVEVNLAIATLNRQQPGDLAEAEKLVASVLDRDGDNLRAWYCQALLKSWGTVPADSIREFQQVAEADPHDAYAAYHTGRGLFEEGRYDEALKWYGEAIARDPYLRSAYYGSFQTLQRLKQPDKAAEMLKTFERLKTNPQARLVEQKYTRMGPKADVLAIDLPETTPVKPAAGPVFAAPRPLAPETLPIDEPGGGDSEQVAPSITVCDFSGDGKLDVCIAAGRQADGGRANVILLSAGERGAPPGWTLAAEHPLAASIDVRAALWGDYDNDGLTDVYFCRRGPNQLWRQVKTGE
ncbi:MAG TPA: tetratricopeptide repeat protein, partial [Pirellulales bacterium]